MKIVRENEGRGTKRNSQREARRASGRTPLFRGSLASNPRPLKLDGPQVWQACIDPCWAEKNNFNITSVPKHDSGRMSVLDVQVAKEWLGQEEMAYWGDDEE